MNFIVCWDLRSSGILYSVERPLLAHVSRQTIGRIFKGWEIQEGSCPWEIACPETSVSNYRSLLRNVAEERGSHLRRSFTPEIVQSLFFPLSICRFIFSDIGFDATVKKTSVVWQITLLESGQRRLLIQHHQERNFGQLTNSCVSSDHWIVV